MTDPFVGQDIRLCHKTGTVRENPTTDDTYSVEVELGGVHQRVVVTDAYVRDQLGGA